MNNATNTKNLTIFFILVELISFYWFLFEHTTDITFYLLLTIYHINNYIHFCQIFCVYKSKFIKWNLAIRLLSTFTAFSFSIYAFIYMRAYEEKGAMVVEKWGPKCVHSSILLCGPPQAKKKIKIQSLGTNQENHTW